MVAVVNLRQLLEQWAAAMPATRFSSACRTATRIRRRKLDAAPCTTRAKKSLATMSVIASANRKAACAWTITPVSAFQSRTASYNLTLSPLRAAEHQQGRTERNRLHPAAHTVGGRRNGWVGMSIKTKRFLPPLHPLSAADR